MTHVHAESSGKCLYKHRLANSYYTEIKLPEQFLVNVTGSHEKFTFLVNFKS